MVGRKPLEAQMRWRHSRWNKIHMAFGGQIHAAGNGVFHFRESS